MTDPTPTNAIRAADLALKVRELSLIAEQADGLDERVAWLLESAESRLAEACILLTREAPPPQQQTLSLYTEPASFLADLVKDTGGWQ